MPTTLTLKNIPDDIYERLKLSATAHRRSLNSEAIVCLERALGPQKVTIEERLRRADELHARLGGPGLSLEEIDELKREGRP